MKIYSNRIVLINLKRELEKIVAQNGEHQEISKLFHNLSFIKSFENDNEYIKFQIYSIISFHSGYPIERIKNKHNLKFDLGINNSEKWIFKRKFNDLIKELGGNKFTTKKECIGLQSVGDCINLVKSKLN